MCLPEQQSHLIRGKYKGWLIFRLSVMKKSSKKLKDRKRRLIARTSLDVLSFVYWDM